jgi:tetratricopeptide (TPR) repeat protein
VALWACNLILDTPGHSRHFLLVGGKYAARVFVARLGRVGIFGIQFLSGLQKRSPSRVPTAVWTKGKIQNWIKSQKPIDAEAAAILKLWESPEAIPRSSLLLLTMQSFAMADAATRDFLKSLSFTEEVLNAPSAEKLLDIKDIDAFYASNLRVHFGRYLTHLEMYEEALAVFEKVSLTETVDPSGYLFFLATCQMKLGHKDDALKTLDLLMNRASEAASPRHLGVAVLMKADLEALEAKSLDDIARHMHDVQRRLKLGRAGEKTQKVEKDIIALLDEMIKKKEDQANKPQGGEGEGKSGKSNGAAGKKAAQESNVKGSTAPGEVDKKKLKPGANWGNMDEKERTRVKNAIARDFPPYYREVIAEYFKKLAERDSK